MTHHAYHYISEKHGGCGTKLAGKCARASYFLWLILQQFNIHARLVRGLFRLDFQNYFSEGFSEQPHTWLEVYLKDKTYLIDLTITQFQYGCLRKLPNYLIVEKFSEFTEHYCEYNHYVEQPRYTCDNINEIYHFLSLIHLDQKTS